MCPPLDTFGPLTRIFVNYIYMVHFVIVYGGDVSICERLILCILE